jgi:threonyl-tRNA synthetase
MRVSIYDTPLFIMSLSLQTLRQSAAEILAYAVSDLFPNITLVSGESTDFGFYYDFIATQPIEEQVIPLIEEKIRSVVKEDLPIHSLEMMRENAATLFQHQGQPLKALLIMQASENIVTIFRLKDFYDYCPQPYAKQTQEIAAFKIMQIGPASRYIQGKGEIHVMRIQGTAFHDTSSLKKFLKSTETAKKREHRLIGKEMDLFSMQEDVAQGCWFWHPKGTVIREVLLDRWRKEHRQLHFQLVASPSIVKVSFNKKFDFFNGVVEESELPVFDIDGVAYTFRTAFAPLHAALFRTKLYSYRDLPVRYAECAEVYVPKRSGPLWGMIHARTCCVDVAHVFCTPMQVVEELISSLQFIDKIIKILGFEYQWHLTLRGQKYAGTLINWDRGIEWIGKALEACQLSYATDKEDTSFIGPLVEARLRDALGREWKGPKVGLDFNCPERFGLRYQGPDDEMHVPVMLVRSLFGSLERFVAILVEHDAGLFPLWLAPEQVRVISVGEKNIDYARTILETIEKHGFRVGVDFHRDQLGSKIHIAKRERVPYIVIVGDKEEKNGVITIRSRSQEEVRGGIEIKDFLELLHAEAS